MQEVSSLQRPANELAFSCNDLMHSDGSLEKRNITKVDSDMRGVNEQWNHLNVKVIERENRSVVISYNGMGFNPFSP